MKVFIILFLLLSSICLFAENIFIEMKVGETKKIEFKGISGGSGSGLGIIEHDYGNNHVIIKALKEGYAKIMIKSKEKENSYTIFVEDPKNNKKESFEEIEKILKYIEGVKYTIKKGTINVTGEVFRFIDYRYLLKLSKYLPFINLSVQMDSGAVKGLILELERLFSEGGLKGVSVSMAGNTAVAFGFVKNESERKLIDLYFKVICDNEAIFTEKTDETGKKTYIYNSDKTTIQCIQETKIDENHKSQKYHYEPQFVESENKTINKEKSNISKEIKENINEITKDVLKETIDFEYFDVKKAGKYLILTGEIYTEENYNKYIKVLNKYPEIISMASISPELQREMLITLKVELKEGKIENLIIRQLMNFYIIDSKKLNEDTKKSIIEIMKSLNIFEVKDVNNYDYSDKFYFYFN